MRVWVLMTLLAVCAATARADDLFDQTKTFTVRSGLSVRIGAHTRWNRRCEVAPMPPITVLDPPHDGRVTTEAGTKIATSSVGSVSCTGRTFPAVVVVYTPNPGFHGRDTLRYQAAYGATLDIRTITIVVP